MIALDSSRNIIKDTKYLERDLSEKEFLVIDDIDDWEKYHFEPYSSDRIVYLGEKDLTYSIYDLEKGILIRAPYRIGEDHIQNPVVRFWVFKIPQLKKLLKNKEINKTNAVYKIKERDGNRCQLCGESDFRTLNVHHIVPRKSPFIVNSFIHSPINQITLCANCHRIEHHVLEHGNDGERKAHVKRMFEINGFEWDDRLQDGFYLPMSEIRKWNKIEVL